MSRNQYQAPHAAPIGLRLRGRGGVLLVLGTASVSLSLASITSAVYMMMTAFRRIGEQGPVRPAELAHDIRLDGIPLIAGIALGIVGIVLLIVGVVRRR
jgi:hypothetical protein